MNKTIGKRPESIDNKVDNQVDDKLDDNKTKAYNALQKINDSYDSIRKSLGTSNLIIGALCLGYVVLGAMNLIAQKQEFPIVNTVQEGYIPTDRIEIEVKDLDDRDELPESYIIVNGRRYHLSYKGNKYENIDLLKY